MGEESINVTKIGDESELTFAIITREIDELFEDNNADTALFTGIDRIDLDLDLGVDLVSDYVLITTKNTNSDFILDLGASRHVIANRSFFLPESFKL